MFVLMVTMVDHSQQSEYDAEAVNSNNYYYYYYYYYYRAWRFLLRLPQHLLTIVYKQDSPTPVSSCR
jgi:hypothetical protein